MHSLLHPSTIRIAALATIFAFAATAGRASAADADGGFATLDAACQDLAVQIDKALTAEKIPGSIVIQSFTNGSAFPNAQISRLLTAAFEAKKYKVQDKGGAPAFVKGTLVVNKASLVIETDLHRTGEGRLQTWRHRVNNVEVAAQGSTFDITTRTQTVDRTVTTPPPAASSTATPPTTAGGSAASTTTNDRVATALQQDAVAPRFILTNQGTVARPATGSPYGVSILDAKTGNPLPIINAEGLAMVQLNMDQEFVLRIANDTPNDLGTSISIDGVNMFVFSEVPEYRSLGKLWIGAGGARIDGWYHTDQRSRYFQMGRYDESVAAQVGVTEGVGGITVTFYGDPATGGGARTAIKPEIGIKAGSFVESHYQTKEAKFGELVAAVTIRYQKADHPTDLPPPAN